MPGQWSVMGGFAEGCRMHIPTVYLQSFPLWYLSTNWNENLVSFAYMARLERRWSLTIQKQSNTDAIL